MTEAVFLAILGLTQALTLAQLRGQALRIRLLEKARDLALDKYQKERSTAATYSARLKAVHADVESCLAGGCDHRPECPVRTEHALRQ